MPINITCQCGKRYKVADSLAGKKIRCRTCRTVVPVPSLPMELENAESLFGDWSSDSFEAQQATSGDSHGSNVADPSESSDLFGVGSETVGFSEVSREPEVASDHFPSSPRNTAAPPMEPGGCDFPGRAFQMAMEVFRDDSDPNAPMFSKAALSSFGLAYGILFVLATLQVVVALTRSFSLDNLGPLIFGLVNLGVILSFAHFSSHYAFASSRLILQQPRYRIASEQQLQLLVAPFLLVGFAVLTIGVWALATDWNIEIDDLVRNIALIAISIPSVAALLRAVLNPAHVGVDVDEGATPAEALCGLAAVIIRAPFYVQRFYFPFSLVICLIGSLLVLLDNVLTLNPMLRGIAMLAVGVGLFGIIFPLVGYFLTFLALASIELTQSILEIRKNTARLP